MVASTIAYIRRSRTQQAAEQAHVEQFEQSQLNRHRELNAKLLQSPQDVFGKTRFGKTVTIATFVSEQAARDIVDNWYRMGSDAWSESSPYTDS